MGSPFLTHTGVECQIKFMARFHATADPCMRQNYHACDEQRDLQADGEPRNLPEQWYLPGEGEQIE